MQRFWPHAHIWLLQYSNIHVMTIFKRMLWMNGFSISANLSQLVHKWNVLIFFFFFWQLLKGIMLRKIMACNWRLGFPRSLDCCPVASSWGDFLFYCYQATMCETISNAAWPLFWETGLAVGCDLRQMCGSLLGAGTQKTTSGPNWDWNVSCQRADQRGSVYQQKLKSGFSLLLQNF